MTVKDTIDYLSVLPPDLPIYVFNHDDVAYWPSGWKIVTDGQIPNRSCDPPDISGDFLTLVKGGVTCD